MRWRVKFGCCKEAVELREVGEVHVQFLELLEAETEGVLLVRVVVLVSRNAKLLGEVVGSTCVVVGRVMISFGLAVRRQRC